MDTCTFESQDLFEPALGIEPQRSLVVAVNRRHYVRQVALHERIFKDGLEECSSHRTRMIDGTVHEARPADEPIIPNDGR